jgi:hypothetical protein
MPVYPTPAAGQAAAADNGQSIGQSKTVDDPPIVASTAWDPYSTNFMPSKVITADYTVDDSPLVILVDCTAGNITVTLQSPEFAEGKTVIIQRIDATASRTVTVTTVAGANVRISTTRALNLSTQYNALVFTAVNDPTYKIWVGR